MKKITLLLVLIATFTFAFGQISQTSQTLEHNKAKIHFTVLGEGQPLLLLSGGPGFSSAYLKGLADSLSRSYRCILLDQRGTGKSVAEAYDSASISIASTLEDIEYVRNYLGLEQWVVLGHSYGGILASYYAVNYPKSVSALILVGTAGFNTKMWEYFSDNIWSRLSPADKELADYWWKVSESLKKQHKVEALKLARFYHLMAILPGYFFDRKISYYAYLDRSLEDLNYDVDSLIWKELVKKDITESSKNYTKPVLIVHGRQDPVGEAVPITVAQTYPNSKLVFINRCGHLSWNEQPAIFYKTIDDFMLGLKD